MTVPLFIIKGQCELSAAARQEESPCEALEEKRQFGDSGVGWAVGTSSVLVDKGPVIN